jgi:AraC-like DNA-binding protein
VTDSRTEPTVFPQAVAIAVATASFVRGCAPEELCAGLGIEPASFADPSRRLPHSLVMRAWQELSEGVDDFGLRAAKMVGTRGNSLVEYAIANAPHLRAALATFVRLSHLLHEAAAHSLDAGAEVAVFRFALERPYEAPHAIWDFLTATQVVRIRALLGEDGDPVRVSLPRRRFVDEAAASAVFRAPIEHGAAPSVQWPRALLDRPIPGHDPNLHGLLTRQLGGSERTERETTEALFPPVERDLLIELRRALRASVLRGDVSVGAIARQLGTSGRSLQRRLGERRTTFQEQLDEARKAVALALLGEHGSSVKHAALTAGFSQVAAFSRAFRRWTGQSPAEYRVAGRSQRAPSPPR